MSKHIKTPKICEACGISCYQLEKLKESGKMRVCSCCNQAYYCSAACQRNHWKHHKPDCSENAKVPRPGDTTLKRIELDIRTLEIDKNENNKNASRWGVLGCSYIQKGKLLGKVKGLESMQKAVDVIVRIAELTAKGEY